MDPNVNALLRRLDSRVSELASELQQVKVQGDMPASLPGQYPGKPIPHVEGVELSIAANTTTVAGNITISADGPFMARGVHFAWRPTAGNQQGIWRPTSSSRSPDVADIDDVIDFYWEYQVTGSHRNRQNIPVPSALTHAAEEGNGWWEFHVEDIFDETATVQIKVTPTTAPSNAGVLFVGFSGAYILK